MTLTVILVCVAVLLALGLVVSRPPELLSARFETDRLAASIAERAAEESTKDAGALPLLSYLLDDMWRQMIHRDDGVLRLPEQAIELGGVLVDRANTFLSSHPNSEGQLRRIFTLKLATVREDGEPTRRRAFRSEFSNDEWRLVSELADHPNRLLVTVTPEAGETYAEVAHEAIFRRWDKLREWIAAEREFLIWRSGLEAARRVWGDTPDVSKHDALLMGFALTQAQRWLAQRAEDLPKLDRKFIVLSKAQVRARRLRGLLYVLVVAVIAGLVGWNRQWASEELLWYTVTRPFVDANIKPYVLRSSAEKALRPDPNQSFRECAPKQQDKDYCPDMVVVPGGSFMMGSPPTDTVQDTDEALHSVTIAKPFAVSKLELTFDEWDTCVTYGGCTQKGDAGWGFGQQPVIYVSWNDAQNYVAWLAKLTGKPYRLLSEAEYEYAARGGMQPQKVYPWGNDIGKNNANCNGCGSNWDNKQTAPVGSFPSNQFGLYDMVGNVWEWVEDCYNRDYAGAPTNGSAWTKSDCNLRVVRGGSWSASPRNVRSADRYEEGPDLFDRRFGFRVGRSLIAP